MKGQDIGSIRKQMERCWDNIVESRNGEPTPSQISDYKKYKEEMKELTKRYISMVVEPSKNKIVDNFFKGFYLQRVKDYFNGKTKNIQKR